ncbi:hypothetical protein IMG5_077470 [Ichthyophthirius multifiliis]|uniref:Actin family protein n=1 Tax=Ichthyophthirius multifiliis TaxID=5932 RepID=G0QQD7_ICHMU|nr:hypothetical protein IMG5_077470 [Ichthyophthirius multifiliis]EGR32566.1 hypothetical protein IMG5_077470 [Ichthyophthirius multifiliis]|eukprot:XP_004036552.1 hypothetical protein IMG5_077470 [Ichthyophthirius multifiliis]
MSDWHTNFQKRIIIDNGSWEIRLGNATNQNPMILQQNLLGNLLYGEQLNNYLDESNLIYIKPQVRGVTVDWDHEIHLLEKMLDDLTGFEQKQNELASYSISYIYNPCMPEKVRQRIIETCFEYFGFDAIYPALSQKMSQIFFKHNYPNKLSDQFQLLIEIGHSATYFVPFFDDEVVNYGIKRLDIGGKLLSNHLKDIITCRYIQLNNDFRMVSQIKNEMCFVSQDFIKDMKMKLAYINKIYLIKKRKNTFQKFFILPDYDTGKQGYVIENYDNQSNQEVLALDKERFTIPELLFYPSDIGLNQNGISQGIFNVVKELNIDLREYFLENIILTGGSSNFQGLSERLQNEIIQNTPEYLQNKLIHIKEQYPSFKGCQILAQSENFQNIVMNRNDYKEYGFEKLNSVYFN